MSKHIGDIGELEFILGCKKRGYIALLPYSSICPYDVAIDNSVQTLKIQVKTCNSLLLKRGVEQPNRYKATIAKGNNSKTLYTPSEVNFFAIYIMPEHLFYIIPQHEITAISNRFYTDKKDHKFSKYLEAWDLLKGPNLNT